MADDREDRSREDLTEEASPHRIEEYRRKGMVAQSRDISSLAVLITTGIATYVMSPRLGEQMLDFMKVVFRTDLSSRLDLGSEHVMRTYLMTAISILASVGLPICCIGFVFGILSSVVQIGAIFSFEPLMPDISKINPLQGIQRMISMKQLLETLKLVCKMIVTLLVFYFFLKSEIMMSSGHMGEGPGYLIANFGRGAKTIFSSLILVFTFFAAIDYGFQKYEYDKNIRMTKQEAKQEHKEREGDPQIRARIRSVQREMARRRMMQAVKKADVVVTNPTHIAVALVYETSKMSAPKVVAKGADFLAQKIKQIAADAGVPLVENVPLARTLYKEVKVGHGIPRVLYQAVAEVLAHVYRLRKKNL